MSTTFGVCRNVYRSIVPHSLRHKLYAITPLSFQRLRSRMVGRLAVSAEHDEIYDAEYYASCVEPGMKISADVMAKSIVERFAPKCGIDVGCGTGALLAALTKNGMKCIGLEYAQAAINICKSRGLDVRKFDLESDVNLTESADVVISTEVAEHLPAKVADRYVDLLCAAAPAAVLTAAVPDGPAGTDHVNEQPNEYWIAKFEARGFDFDRETSFRWRESWSRAGVSAIYFKTVMVFTKRA